MKKNIAIAVLSVALIIICAVLFKECSKECPNIPDNSSSDTVWVDLPPEIIHDTVDNPVPYKVVEHHYETGNIDTSAILSDYVNEKRYNMDFSDTSYKMDVNISLEKNVLKSFDYSLRIEQRQKEIKTTIVKKEIFSFALGGGFGYRMGTKMPIAELGLQLSFKNNIFGANYELFDKGIKLDYKYKIATITK